MPLDRTRSIVDSLTIKPTGDAKADRNFEEIKRILSQMHPHVNGVPTGDVNLSTGANRIKPSIPRPTGRHIVYQSAAATLTDDGLDSAGFWVIQASAPCIVRLIFF